MIARILSNPSRLFVSKRLLDEIIYPVVKPLMYIEPLRQIRIRLNIQGFYYFFRPFVISDLLVLFAEWEPYVKDVFHPKKGDIVIDIGAHIGTYTLNGAKRVGEKGMVVSFEPDPENFALLSKNIQTNNLRQVKAFNAAVGERKGDKKFRMDFDPLLSGFRGQHVKAEIATQVFTLDEVAKQLNLRHIDWLKIDAEGAETQILEGAHQVLSNIVKNIIIETHHPERITKLLIAEGFRIRRLHRLYYLGIKN